MNNKLPTLLIMTVMVLIGVTYWIDLNYYTDQVTGFVTRGMVWTRYAVLLIPLMMSLLGLKTVGPLAISVMRVKNRNLAKLFIVAAVVGAVYGITLTLTSLSPLLDGKLTTLYDFILGLLLIWYGVWMFLVALQLFNQRRPSPTNSSVWGILAALPYAGITVQRILIRPSSLHRVGVVASCIGALLLMLWFGFLLRSLYIALPRRRVRLTYITGVFAFLFATCLELPYSVYIVAFKGAQTIQLLESLNMAAFGLVAGGVSVAIAGQSGMETAPVQEERAGPTVWKRRR